MRRPVGGAPLKKMGGALSKIWIQHFKKGFHRLWLTHHNKLGRLSEDLLPQFESGRSWEEVDALLVKVSYLRVDVLCPEEVIF